MGTTMSFYNILNNGFTPEQLQKIISPLTKGGVIGYNASSKWLPFFEANRCEGYIASSKDAKELSQVFGTPVLVFSIFDSDILLVSYSNAAKNVVCNYVKPNFDDPEMGLHSTVFPECMLDFCNQDKLKEIWEEPDVVFADERMEKICKLIEVKLLYHPDYMPEGFQAIYAT